MLPPCRSAMPFAMESPTPSRCRRFGRVSPVEAVKQAGKGKLSTAWQLLSTVRTGCLFPESPTWMAPSGSQYFTALSNRMKASCRRAPSSPFHSREGGPSQVRRFPLCSAAGRKAAAVSHTAWARSKKLDCRGASSPKRAKSTRRRTSWVMVKVSSFMSESQGFSPASLSRMSRLACSRVNGVLSSWLASVTNCRWRW